MTTNIGTERRVQLLTVPEVAQRLSISPRKVWQLVSEDQLQTVHIGSRCTRVEASELEAFIERLKRAAIHRN